MRCLPGARLVTCGAPLGRKMKLRGRSGSLPEKTWPGGEHSEPSGSRREQIRALLRASSPPQASADPHSEWTTHDGAAFASHSISGAPRVPEERRIIRSILGMRRGLFSSPKRERRTKEASSDLFMPGGLIGRQYEPSPGLLNGATSSVPLASKPPAAAPRTPSSGMYRGGCRPNPTGGCSGLRAFRGANREGGHACRR